MVAEILSRVEREGISLRAAMEDFFEEHNIHDSTLKGLIRAFSLGVLRNFLRVDFIIRHFFGRKYDQLDIFSRNLLRATIYELKFRNISIKRCYNILSRISQFNIDLNLLKDIKAFDEKNLISKLNYEERLSLEYSQPPWVVKYLLKLLGRDETIKMLKRFNRPATLWIRVNTLLIKRRELIKRLRKKGIIAEEDADLPDVIRVIEYKIPLAKLSEYKRGYFYIQDKASILVSHVLNPQPNEKILDLCAAPGSKTTHVAQLSGDTAFIIATDKSYTRLKILQNSAYRLRISSVERIVTDSRFVNFRGKFDKVLVDPDCSSLGRLGHSPEVRLWFKPEYIKSLTRLQYELLNKAIDLTKKDGIIVYSTCTFTLEENEILIKRILEERNDVEIIKAKPFIGREGFLNLKQAQRLFPHIHDTLGFFIAKLLKIK